jgi:predicted RNA-binding protein (TIGR00451 family)
LSDYLNPLQKIRAVADYQFRRGAGDAIFPVDVDMRFSLATKKIRFVYLNDNLLATLRPTTGLLALTLAGASRLLKRFEPPTLRVRVDDEVEDFVAKGSSVFAKYVTEADPEIRPLEEVIVVNSKDKLLAVGKAILTGREMLAFKKGVAVKIRKGIEEGESRCEK